MSLIKRSRLRSFTTTLVTTLALGLAAAAPAAHAATTTLLNVSYDPTRELYEDYNKEFSKYWKTKSGNDVEIKQAAR